MSSTISFTGKLGYAIGLAGLLTLSIESANWLRSEAFEVFLLAPAVIYIMVGLLLIRRDQHLWSRFWRIRKDSVSSTSTSTNQTGLDTLATMLIGIGLLELPSETLNVFRHGWSVTTVVIIVICMLMLIVGVGILYRHNIDQNTITSS